MGAILKHYLMAQIDPRPRSRSERHATLVPEATSCGPRVGWMWTVHHDALVAGKYLALKEYVNAETAIVRRSGAIGMWIVQVALKRPYTFIVLAFLIAIFGSLSAVRSSTDIFTSINIPVVSVVWPYSGLLPK